MAAVSGDVATSMAGDARRPDDMQADTDPGCQPETDSEFCGRLAITCGAYANLDNCANNRAALCGACPLASDRCGGGGIANACGHGFCAGDALITLPSAGGSGSPEDPHLICTAEQLNAIGDAPEFMDKSFLLRRDLDLNELAAPYTAIGSVTNPFAGSFDGAGLIIANLTIAVTSGDNVGMFSRLDGEVTSLTLTGVHIDAPSSTRVGGLAGETSTADIANVIIAGTQAPGLADIQGGGSVGGLIGRSQSSTITESSVHAHVYGGGNVGGMVGYSRSTPIKRSYSEGTVVAPTGWQIGGLIGNCWSEGGPIESFSRSNVIGGSRVGGLIGYQNGFCDAIDSFAAGSVTGQHMVGGLTGLLNTVPWVERAYASGRVIATGDFAGDRDAGGLAGAAANVDNVRDAFWNNEVNADLEGVPNIADGAEIVGLASAQMRTRASFVNVGWNMANLWSVIAGRNDGYPLNRADSRPCAMVAFDPLAWGLGTPAEPHYICTDMQLRQLALPANEAFLGRSYALVADLDLSAAPTVPIGNATTPFAGTFHGNEHRITGLNIVAGAESGVGLFGVIDGARIHTLKLHNARVEAGEGASLVGIIVGSAANSSIEFSEITSDSSFDTASKTDANVSVDSSLAAPSTMIGGVVGSASSTTLSDLSIQATIWTGDGAGSIGGLLGDADTATVERCVSNITMRVGHDSTGVGGVGGSVSRGTRFSKSSVVGVISAGERSTSIGGLAGSASQSCDFIECGSSLDITVAPTTSAVADRVGGLVGAMRARSVISNCYSAGTLSHAGILGGIVGSLEDSTLEFSHSMNMMTPTPLARGAVGVLVDAVNVVTGVVWNSELSPGVTDSIPAVVAVDNATAATEATFTNLGWLFWPGGAWLLLPSGNYPILVGP